MADCSKCTNALFQEFWGEYKCAVRQHIIYHPELFLDCEHYNEGNPGYSKENEEYELS